MSENYHVPVNVLGIFYFSGVGICKYSQNLKKTAEFDICPCTDKRQGTSAVALPNVS